MRTELRVGRPFIIEPGLQQALVSSELAFPDGSVLRAGDQLLIPPPKSLDRNRPLHISFRFDLEELARSLKKQGLDPKEVSLFVLASLNRLRRTEVIHRIRVSELTSKDYTVDLHEVAPRWVKEALLSARLNLSCYLCLETTVQAPPLRPQLCSTWLSRAKFEIGTAEPEYSVTIQPLGDAQYELGVPKGAYCWFEFKGDSTDTPSGEYQATIFVDPDVLSSLKQYETSPASMNAQAKLESMVIENLLRRVVTDCLKADLTSDDWGELESREPLVAAVIIIRNIAKQALKEPRDYFRLLLEDTELALSHVGKVLKLPKQDLDLMKPLTEDSDS